MGTWAAMRGPERSRASRQSAAVRWPPALSPATAIRRRRRSMRAAERAVQGARSTRPRAPRDGDARAPGDRRAPARRPPSHGPARGRSGRGCPAIPAPSRRRGGRSAPAGCARALGGRRGRRGARRRRGPRCPARTPPAAVSSREHAGSAPRRPRARCATSWVCHGAMPASRTRSMIAWASGSSGTVGAPRCGRLHHAVRRFAC